MLCGLSPSHYFKYNLSLRKLKDDNYQQCVGNDDRIIHL